MLNCFCTRLLSRQCCDLLLKPSILSLFNDSIFSNLRDEAIITHRSRVVKVISAYYKLQQNSEGIPKIFLIARKSVHLVISFKSYLS